MCCKPFKKTQMNKMKLTYRLLIILTILTSCSSDDKNSNEETNEKLIGTWIVTTRTFDWNSSEIPGYNYSPGYNIVKFTSDQRTEFIYKEYGINGEDISEFGNWSKKGNTLTITWDEADPGLEKYILTITELTENSLKWDNLDSVEGTPIGTLTETFTKD